MALSMTDYRFTDGPHCFNSDQISADTAGSELSRIREENGRLTPQLVVDEARSDDAPLHPAFEWRDDVAAECYRNVQASSLIKTVKVVNPLADPKPAYVKVSTAPVRYESSKKVAESNDAFESAFMIALDRLSAAQKALDHLREIAQQRNRGEYRRYESAARAVGRITSMVVKGDE